MNDTTPTTSLGYRLASGTNLGLSGTIHHGLGIATVCAEVVEPGDHERRRVWMQVRADDGVARPDDLDGIEDGLPTTAETMSTAALDYLEPVVSTIDPDHAGLVVTFWRSPEAATAA